ncbi:hypothetical protein [Desulfoscipio sp. XC116]|uniref:hypothetical protein n=1 Tax=Desulfoscipio sp. XC116 TaxID=3144975 RepID=UPI00325BB477
MTFLSFHQVGSFNKVITEELVVRLDFLGIFGFKFTAFTALDITSYGGPFIWNFGSLILLIAAGIGSNIVKEKYKEN